MPIVFITFRSLNSSHGVGHQRHVIKLLYQSTWLRDRSGRM